MMNALLVIVATGAAATACTPPPPKVPLVEEWPAQPSEKYKAVTSAWTRSAVLRGAYQEVLDLSATFKSPDWRAAHAERDAEFRGLDGAAKASRLDEARAEQAGPYEVELLVTTWDRRENDLDRGAKSVWRVVMVDDKGHEVSPLEIVRDKRPTFQISAEFPAAGDFTTAYVARFPRTTPLLGPGITQLRLRMSSERGGVELTWLAP
nr:hypothetical protein [Kofleriaceae bacterium]